jgi:Raf kinase inhibitor-like YbhB/YbcL family protein
MLAALVAAFTLASPAFHAGGTIPKRYTCDGANISPALRWTQPPRGTKSFSLTVVDPDAPGGDFVHWRIPRLAGSLRGLAAASHLGARNSAGTDGWTGPCPPAGPAHHYHFELRALAANGEVLATAVLIARYRRA